MKQELIMDALEFLDEDIIVETDELRQGKNVVKKPHVFKWNYIALVAAAVCLCILGVSMITPGGNKSAGPAEDYNGGVKTDGCDMEHDGELAESQRMLVRIDEWKTDGFYGTVVDNGGQGSVMAGMCIAVEFNSDMRVDIEGYRDYAYDGTNAKSCGIKAGTVVSVDCTELIPHVNNSTGADSTAVTSKDDLTVKVSVIRER
ncbi:MAG: hypothetical protein IJB96_10415 [Lachnospira sp.]|nr:hypothetical protein [Lachnospira sp.]